MVPIVQILSILGLTRAVCSVMYPWRWPIKERYSSFLLIDSIPPFIFVTAVFLFSVSDRPTQPLALWIQKQMGCALRITWKLLLLAKPNSLPHTAAIYPPPPPQRNIWTNTSLPSVVRCDREGWLLFRQLPTAPLLLLLPWLHAAPARSCSHGWSLRGCCFIPCCFQCCCSSGCISGVVVAPFLAAAPVAAASLY
jgi:hypothetical protein